VTLYHWDLPQALQDEGGWLMRSTAEAFAGYAGVLAEALGDRVENWITLNEPWVAAMLGHVEGVFAPGIMDWPSGLAAGHHLLLGHGLAVDALRSFHPDANVGIALDCRPCTPASPRADDVDAARHFDGYRNRWFFDPVFGMGYPEDMLRAYHDRGRLPQGHPVLADADLGIVSRPIDFLGLNYYTSIRVTPDIAESEAADATHDPPSDRTEMGWEITPGALTEFLQRVGATWKPRRIVVTENGASYSDGPDPAGRIRDVRRIDYLDRHIAAVADAVAAGVPVDGYFVWSLLDNLEWVAGFGQRFGLVWVDRDTLRRVPKDSFAWYRQRIAATRRA
jgi:beta-glucosidase